ncbi:cyclic nucleotide-binding domain-containing protein [Candidatus Gracilibacteria bacterium]|nr:cyclic nucleotide-binding domain-containing protein [Candidatus Gracilibacteria bacterium]
MSEFIEILRKIPFFKGLTDQQLEAVGKSCEQKTFEKGAVVVQEKEKPDGMHIIIFGEVEIVKSEKVIVKLGTNDFFGELALFSVSKPRTATVRVVSEKLMTLFIPAATFNYIKLGLSAEVFDEIVKRIEANSK